MCVFYKVHSSTSPLWSCRNQYSYPKGAGQAANSFLGRELIRRWSLERLPSMQSERTMAEAQHHCQETKQFWELLNGWPNLDAAMYRLWWGLQKLMWCMFSNVADVTTWAIRSLSIKCELWFSTKCLFCNLNTPGCQQCKDCPQELRRRSRFWS